MMKTENAEQVGKHAFEVAGLGLAPFKFVGASENVITHGDGTQQAGGCCDYCFTGIRTECHVLSADGKRFKVGCNCIAKVGDAGLLKAYKQSPEYRKHQRDLRNARNAAKEANARAEVAVLIFENAEVLVSRPHPYGFTDRVTGEKMTALDYVAWTFTNRGAANIINFVKGQL